jgi:predicted transcriptional regulator
MNLSVQNASSKLKKLVDDGYILRFEETAESGGIEFIYQAIE